MNRRSLLALASGALVAGLAGCSAVLGRSESVGSLTVIVVNESSRAYDVVVTVRDRAGEVADETDLGRLPPNTGHVEEFSNLLRQGGPYEVVVDGGDWRATSRWDVTACASHDVTVTLSGDGDVATASECLG